MRVVAGQNEAQVQPLVLRERRFATFAEVSAWPDTRRDIEGLIGSLLGVAVPDGTGFIATREETSLITAAPGRYFVASARPGLAGELAEQIGAHQGAVVDLSHSRCGIRIAGAGAAFVLAKGLAIDLHPDQFAVGRAAEAPIHHIGVLVMRPAADTFDCFVSRGFAISFFEWLSDAALEMGYRIDAPLG